MHYQRIILVGVGLSAAGCVGVTISGTISLPGGLIAAPGMTCGDIEVAAFTRVLDSQNELTSATATGDIATGRCQYAMSVPSGQSFRPAHGRITRRT